MAESLTSRLGRWAFNLFPAYWCTGARITYLADDFREVRIENLGAGYEVWDKSASIRFRRPGRGTLRARFLLAEEELDEIRRTLAEEPTTDRRYTVDLVGEEGEVHATIEKVVHVRKAEESG